MDQDNTPASGDRPPPAPSETTPSRADARAEEARAWSALSDPALMEAARDAVSAWAPIALALARGEPASSSPRPSLRCLSTEWAARRWPISALDNLCAASGSASFIEMCGLAGHGGATDALLTSGLADWGATEASRALADLAHGSAPPAGASALCASIRGWMLSEWREAWAGSAPRGGPAGASAAQAAKAQRLARKFLSRAPGARSEFIEGFRCALATACSEIKASEELASVVGRSSKRALNRLSQFARINVFALESDLKPDFDKAREALGAIEREACLRAPWLASVQAALSFDSVDIIALLIEGARTHGVDLLAPKACSLIVYGAEFDDGERVPCSMVAWALSSSAFSCAAELAARGAPTGASPAALESRDSATMIDNPLIAFNRVALDTEAARRAYQTVGLALAEEALSRGLRAPDRAGAARWAESMALAAPHGVPRPLDRPIPGRPERLEAAQLELCAKLSEWAGAASEPLSGMKAGPRL